MTDFFKTGKKTFTLSYYTFLHCLVDFCCIYYMVKEVRISCLEHNFSHWIIYVILYNMTAFAGQLPVGMIGDIIKRNSLMVLGGLICILAAYAGSFFGIAVLPAVLLLGIGNAFFHVGGGREAMNFRDDKCAPLGIFVSTGAFGVFGGKWINAQGMNWVPAMTAVLAAACVIMIFISLSEKNDAEEKIHVSFRPADGGYSVLLAFCSIAVVVIRSFAGNVFIFPWSKGWLAFIMTAGVVLGKALGGIIADKFGIRRTVLASLSICTILLAGANASAVMGITGVFLFNMTMPITLSLLAMQFPKAKGAVFGALTFAIFAGLIPSYFCDISKFAKPYVYVILSAFSLLLLYVPLIIKKIRSREV